VEEIEMMPSRMTFDLALARQADLRRERERITVPTDVEPVTTWSGPRVWRTAAPWTGGLRPA
jgi:hypothetical protein